MIVCIAEDRPTFQQPIMLLILSLTRHCEGLAIELFFPAASEDFKVWLRKFPKVNLTTEPFEGVDGWNVKPHVLLKLLGAGYDDVLWIDSDIIVTRDFRDVYEKCDAGTLVATEEALWGSHSDENAMRARAWGLDIGRTLPFTINTAVLRVTSRHIPLLTEWQRLLSTELYSSAQRLDWSTRPAHLFGDQDVLTALLCSTPFSHIEVKFLMRGSDIIQYFGLSGYTCLERITNLINGPPRFIHSQVHKPWVKFQKRQSAKSLREFIDMLYLDLSPYTLAAARYRRDLQRGCGWMRPQTILAAILRALGLSYSPLVGFPIAAMADLVRVANLKLVKRLYFRPGSQ